MRGNGGGKCYGTVAMNLYDGMKGSCIHVSTPALKAVMELRKSV